MGESISLVKFFCSLVFFSVWIVAVALVFPSVYSPECVTAMTFKGRTEPTAIVLIMLVPARTRKKGFIRDAKYLSSRGFRNFGSCRFRMSTVQDLMTTRRTKHRPEPPVSPIHPTHRDHTQNPLKMIMPYSMQAQPLQVETDVV